MTQPRAPRGASAGQGSVPPAKTPRAYAPYDFEPDASQFGLSRSSIAAPSGSLQILATPRRTDSVTLFLHGLNGSWTTWTPLLQCAAGGAESSTLLGRDVLLIDMRKMLPPVDMASLSSFGGQLLEHIAKSGWKSVEIVGHSTGATLGFTMAAQHPAQVSALKVVSGGFVALFDAVRAQRSQAAADTVSTAPIDPRVKRAADQFDLVSHLGLVVGPTLRLASRTGLIPRIAGGMYAHASELPPKVQRSVSENFSAAAIRNTLALGRAFPTSDIYETVTTPVINVWGAVDPLIAKTDSDYLRTALSDYRGVTIADAGHCAHIEQPAAVLRELFGTP